MAYVNHCDCGSPVPSEFYQIERNVTAINNNPPYPDPNGSGYWMIYNPVKRKYELSDVKVPVYTGDIDVDYVNGGDSTDFQTGVFDDTLKAHIQIRHDTEAKWNANNPVLAIGEWALTTDGDNKGKFKLGDGTTAWSSLNYFVADTGNYVTRQMLEDGDVEVHTATTELIGGIKSSDAENEISVSEDGIASVNSLDVSKLENQTGTILVLNGGSAPKEG